MATSGTYSFLPRNADFIDEAFERIGVDPSELSGRHIKSALRSTNLLFSEWQVLGVRQWKVDQQILELDTTNETYTLPTATVDILTAVLRRFTSGSVTESTDTPLYRINRDEYLLLHDKDLSGLPDRYFIDKARSQTDITIWQKTDNETDQIIYNRIVRFEDAGTMVDDLDIPHRWFEAMAAGLASKLALKYNKKDFPLLDSLSERAFKRAKSEDRERGSTHMSVSLDGRFRSMTGG